MIEKILRGSIKDCSDIELPSLLGPGPTGLIGYVNEDLGPGTNKGFFGEVSVDELINGEDLASLIGLTVGTSQNSDAGWLKYVLDGRILYIAKRTFRHSIAWDELHAVNAVYGDRVIQIGDYQFKIGLLTGSDTDPTWYNAPGTVRSEWTRLLYPTVLDVPSYPKTGQIGDNWADYTQDDLNLVSSSGNGSYSWCQETSSSDASHRVTRGYYSVADSGFDDSSNANTSLGWRPRLELVTS